MHSGGTGARATNRQSRGLTPVGRFEKFGTWKSACLDVVPGRAGLLRSVAATAPATAPNLLPPAPAIVPGPHWAGCAAALAAGRAAALAAGPTARSRCGAVAAPAARRTCARAGGPCACADDPCARTGGPCDRVGDPGARARGPGENDGKEC